MTKAAVNSGVQVFVEIHFPGCRPKNGKAGWSTWQVCQTL